MYCGFMQIPWLLLTWLIGHMRPRIFGYYVKIDGIGNGEISKFPIGDYIVVISIGSYVWAWLTKVSTTNNVNKNFWERFCLNILNKFL